MSVQEGLFRGWPWAEGAERSRFLHAEKEWVLLLAHVESVKRDHSCPATWETWYPRSGSAREKENEKKHSGGVCSPDSTLPRCESMPQGHLRAYWTLSRPKHLRMKRGVAPREKQKVRLKTSSFPKYGGVGWCTTTTACGQRTPVHFLTKGVPR